MIKQNIIHTIKHNVKKTLLPRAINRTRAYVESKIPRRASINPLQIYRVDPSEINIFYGQEDYPQLSSIYLSPILGGEWDKRAESLQDCDIIYSLQRHFSRGVEWENTDFYMRGKKAVMNGEEWVGQGSYDSMEEFRQYLDNIDHLYSLIKSEGFKTQEELYHDGLESRIQVSRAVGMHEVTVNIGRDGDYIHHDGWHRLAISKALDLDSIPVRINARHEKWQEKRRESLQRGKPLIEDHPDLTELFEPDK